MNKPPRGDEFRRLGNHMNMLHVRQQPVPNMTMHVESGSFWVNGTSFVEFLAGNSGLVTKPLTGAKWVVVALNPQAQITLIDGTSASANPAMPAIPVSAMPLAAAYIQANTTAITDEMIFDIRPVFYTGSTPVAHEVLTGRDAVASHPVSAITGLQAALDAKVQADQIDDMLADKADRDGTSSSDFTLNQAFTGAPTGVMAELKAERGDEDTVSIRYTEGVGWQATNDGTTFFGIGAGSSLDASTTVKGVAKLSVAPASATEPIALGANDPSVTNARTPTAHSHVDAASSVKGFVKLSLDPVSATEPIAVGTNDARMTDARTPTAHSHDPSQGATRPVTTKIGFMHFDTNLTPPRPIFWSGTEYVDAAGLAV